MPIRDERLIGDFYLLHSADLADVEMYEWVTRVLRGRHYVIKTNQNLSEPTPAAALASSNRVLVVATNSLVSEATQVGSWVHQVLVEARFSLEARHQNRVVVVRIDDGTTPASALERWPYVNLAGFTSSQTGAAEALLLRSIGSIVPPGSFPGEGS